MSDNTIHDGYEVQVVVTVQVSPDEQGTRISKQQARNAALEAIDNALRHAEANGFEHALSERASISYTDAELAK